MGELGKATVWAAVLGLCGAEAGATPVLYSGGTQDEAVDRVAWNAQLDADELQPVDLSTVVERGPSRLVGDGVWRPCRGVPSGDLLTMVAASRKAWMYARVEQAELALHHLNQVVACSVEPVDIALAYDAFFMLGVVRTVGGDSVGAGDAFQRAAILDPNRGWDENFAPAHGQATFEEARTLVAEAPRATLHLLPSDGESQVDGRAGLPTVILAPGPHVLRTDEVRGWVELGPGAVATWFVPAAVPEDPAEWAETQPQDLARLIAVTRPSDEPVYVTTPGGVWASEPGSGRFEALLMVPPPRPAALRRGLLGGGAVALAGGAVTGALFYRQTLKLNQGCVDANDNGATCEDNADAFQTATTLTYAGETAAVIGALLASTGLVLELQAGRRARVLLTTNGTGLEATVSSAEVD